MTLASAGVEAGPPTRAAVAATCDQVRPLVVPGAFQQAVVVVGDVVGLMAIIVCIPVVILAIATPIVLCVRLLLWVAGQR